jgi:hypothetical protein
MDRNVSWPSINYFFNDILPGTEGKYLGESRSDSDLFLSTPYTVHKTESRQTNADIVLRDVEPCFRSACRIAPTPAAGTAAVRGGCGHDEGW